MPNDAEPAPTKVIHVVFGPGGGRVREPLVPSASRAGQGPRAQTREPELPPTCDAREPFTDVFTASEASRLIGLSPSRLRSLERAGIVAPSGRSRGRRAYTFADLISLRAAHGLLESRVRLREVARAVEALRATLPKVTRPLAELRVTVDGQRVLVRSDAGAYEPSTGQLTLNFGVAELRDEVVRVLRPHAGRERARSAYDLYMRASAMDEDPTTMDEAEALYLRALELDPWLAIAYTNLGNIRFRRDDEAGAERYYQKALALDAKQPEAQYNLGYLLLDRGLAAEAIPFFEGAIAADPKFADAYFNLAMAHEGAGDPARARPAWRRYLDIEPTGTWAEIARRHL